MSGAQSKAVVLLSGGLDSSTTLAIARTQGFDIIALSFDYGQRQAQEVDAARRVAATIGVSSHLVLNIDLGLRGGSALTSDQPVPKGRDPHRMADSVPVTYVPARNTIFLAHALGCAETVGAFDIFIGANAVDFSGYPDCRPEFIDAFETLANVATGATIDGKHRFTIRAPLLHLSKAEIIQTAVAHGLDLALTHSCYDPQDGLACGSCDACILRREGFEAAGISDPTQYFPLPTAKGIAP